eukprot:gene9673-biopygen11573
MALNIWSVACVSRTLNPAERNYAAWKGELLAAVYGIKAFRPYLLGQQFQLITDHRALLWLLTHKNPLGQQARWLLSLSEYQFSLVHRAVHQSCSSENPADAPSREPLACMADWTGSRMDSGDESWVLPAVLLADGTPDPVQYTHDSLAVDLGLQPSSSAVATAAAVVLASPGLVLAQEAQGRALTDEEATASLLFALSVISASSGDAITEYDNSLSPLLGGGGTDACISSLSGASAWHLAGLRQMAGSWVGQARAGKSSLVPPRMPVLAEHAVNVDSVAVSFFPAALSAGVVLYEPFGGLCAGLEMVLKAGFCVQQYYYSDIDPAAQLIAAHRLRCLQAAYPDQLPLHALQFAFLQFPADVKQVDASCVQRAVQQHPGQQWLLRPPGRTVALALLPGRCAQPVVSRERAPYFPCNQPGGPRAAWPTLMSRPQSYAFRPGQPGSIWDCSNPAAAFWDEPSAQEREVSLGYEPGSTAAAGVSEQQRRSALGQCIDANALQVLMAICQAWWFDDRSFDLPACGAAASVAAALVVDDSSVSDHAFMSYPALHVNCIAATAQGALTAGSGSGEIWTDHSVLTALQQGVQPSDATPAERKRVQRRLKLYAWDQQHQQLNRVMPDGTYRIVPKPAERAALVQQQHEQCGHFGVRRTAALLHGKYWWHGMVADVSKVISRCPHCDRVRATFSDRQEDLQSIPISSLGFRWHIDLAGPLPVSKRGSRFVMVAVEAFSKYLVAVPLPDKKPETVALAFLQHVLSRFAAPGQVVSDNGTGFTQGAFKQLLLDCLIDHNLTSVCHPRANGQAEKAVHVVKRALSTMCIQKHDTEDWDDDVAFLMLGYNCSTHSSTGYSPYLLMHARQPIAPPAVRTGMVQPLDYEDESAAAEDLLQWQRWVQQHMPEALENLSIAQHRDQKRYAVVKPSGVLQLEGKCGRTSLVRQEHCAPCHLPDIDGYHMHCLQPPVSAVPDGVWLCHDCVNDGYTAADVAERLAQRDLVQEQQRLPTLFPDAAMSRRDKAAAALHGRLVKKVFDDPLSGHARVFWGRVHFRGAQMRPNYFLVQQASLASALRAAEQLQPAFVAAYQPGFHLSHQVEIFLCSKSRREQGGLWVGKDGGHMFGHQAYQVQEACYLLYRMLLAIAAVGQATVLATAATGVQVVSRTTAYASLLARLDRQYHCCLLALLPGISAIPGAFASPTQNMDAFCDIAFKHVLPVAIAALVWLDATGDVVFEDDDVDFSTWVPLLDLVAAVTQVQAAAAVESAELLALRQQHAAELQQLRLQHDLDVQQLRRQLQVKADRLDCELSNIAGLAAQVDKLLLQQQSSE